MRESLVGSLFQRELVWNEMGLNPSTPSWYGIQTRSHALPKLFFVVSNTMEMVFAITLWQRVLIQSCVHVGKLSVILNEIWRRIWRSREKP